MRRLLFLGVVLTFAAALGASQAWAQAGQGFGYNFHWMYDDDGDGIPNGQDDDWAPPLDGSGYQIKNGFRRILNGFVAARNGDNFNYRYGYQYREKQFDSLGDALKIRLRLHTRDCE